MNWKKQSRIAHSRGCEAELLSPVLPVCVHLQQALKFGDLLPKQ